MPCFVPCITPAHTFEALLSVLRASPEHPQAEVHAVNLVALLEVMPDRRACVALVGPESFTRYEGLEHATQLLARYDVTLYQTWHAFKPAFFLFAQLADAGPNPAGSPVVLPVPEPELELAA